MDIWVANRFFLKNLFQVRYFSTIELRKTSNCHFLDEPTSFVCAFSQQKQPPEPQVLLVLELLLLPPAAASQNCSFAGLCPWVPEFLSQSDVFSPSWEYQVLWVPWPLCLGPSWATTSHALCTGPSLNSGLNSPLCAPVLGKLKQRQSYSGCRCRGAGLWPTSDIAWTTCLPRSTSIVTSKSSSTLDKKRSGSWDFLSPWGPGKSPKV